MKIANQDGNDLAVVSLCEHPQSLGAVVNWVDAQWAGFSGRSREETEARFARELDEDPDSLPLTLVAVDTGGRSCGVLSLRERDSTDFDPGTTPWICNVYVDPAQRGRGIAALLIEEAILRAARLGFERIFIASGKGPENLYTRLGFKVYRKISDAREDQYLMQRGTR